MRSTLMSPKQTFKENKVSVVLPKTPLDLHINQKKRRTLTSVMQTPHELETTFNTLVTEPSLEYSHNRTQNIADDDASSYIKFPKIQFNMPSSPDSRNITVSAFSNYMTKVP